MITFETLELRDLLSGNPDAGGYSYVPVSGRIFHPMTQDLAATEAALAQGVGKNTDMQDLIDALANESPIARAWGVDPTDVRQGVVGDCALIADLGEVALRQPWFINQAIVANPDGTITVTLLNNGTQIPVTMSPDLPASSGQLVYAQIGASVTDAGAILWPAWYEKAMAQHEGTYLGVYTSGGIAGIFPYEGFERITGENPVQLSSAERYLSLATSEQQFLAAWNAGNSIVFATWAGNEPDGLVNDHCYFPVAVDTVTGDITVENPWGIGQGLITMPWSQAVNDFIYFDRTL